MISDSLFAKNSAIRRWMVCSHPERRQINK